MAVSYFITDMDDSDADDSDSSTRSTARVAPMLDTDPDVLHSTASYTGIMTASCERFVRSHIERRNNCSEAGSVVSASVERAEWTILDN